MAMTTRMRNRKLLRPTGTALLQRALLVLLVAAASAAAWAAPLSVGQPLPPLATSDQHDRPWRVEPGTRTLLFAADKAASDLVADVLRPQGTSGLSARQALFLADIHAMPALVTRMFALPALRELPFAIGLGRDVALAADLPRQKGQVTVVALQDGVVTALQFVATPDALRQALGLR